ncbi:hypothetical protein [Anaerobutyricum soehngenii]|nr:hypothetical protein [Anaerobutyricum soehngenii]
MIKMLNRILITLRSRIWDMPVFLFSVYSKSIVCKNGGCSRRL